MIMGWTIAKHLQGCLPLNPIKIAKSKAQMATNSNIHQPI